MNILRSLRWLILAAAVGWMAAPAPAQISIGISVHFGPPVLPVYVQPMCPAPNLMWTPGHWQWDPDFGDYYWVPGAWVPVPYVGALWTPGYWGWSNGLYMWHAGYWGPHIGYYGGVNYGGGYMGIGFAGGTWNGGVFAYNTAVVNVNRTVITNVYINRTIVEQTTIVNVNHVAYSGGPGGIQHQPTPEEQIAEHDQHVPATRFQTQHQESARQDKSNFSKNNGGHPTHFAEQKPLAAETHPAPAGFKPPPPKPLTELAKAQAPPSIQHAAAESSTRTMTAAKSNPPPRTNPANAGGGKPANAGGAHPANAQAHPAAEGNRGMPAAHPNNTPQSHPNTSPHPETSPRPTSESRPAPQSHPATQSHPESKPKNPPPPKKESKKPE